MSQTSQSFIEQLEAAATPAVIGTKKAAKALAPSDIETSQQDKLGDMPAYKRRQKKMEKGLLNQEVEKEESPKVDEEALSELASLFHGITGQEPEEEPKVIEPVLLPEENIIVPFIDPKVIEEGAKQLQDLFTDISGIELFGERLEEEEVIEIPVTPPETFDISEVTSVTSQIFGGHKVLPNNTLYDPTNTKHIQVVQDVDALLEKHKEDLPEEPVQILQTDAPDKTADYLSKSNLTEYDTSQSMPFTGANSPLVSSGEFTTAVTGILRKMMATGPGSGVVEFDKLDDVDNTTAYPSGAITDGMVLAYRPNTAPFNLPYKWQAADTPPVGDIHGVTAGVGLSGGGTSGVVTLNLDVSELTAIGATAALTDYVVIQDVTDDTTKKVLVSNLFSTVGDITGVTAGTGLSGGGTSGDVTLNVEASQTQITSIGTIGTGTWQGTAIADGYLGTGINANKLANGSVTNTELQYINSLSSNAQTQITNVKTTADAAASKAFAIAQAVALG